MKDKFMKNGVFSLEYDKETLKDMVLKLQNESQKQKEVINKIKKELIENEVLDELPFDASERICDLFEEVSE